MSSCTHQRIHVITDVNYVRFFFKCLPIHVHTRSVQFITWRMKWFFTTRVGVTLSRIKKYLCNDSCVQYLSVFSNIHYRYVIVNVHIALYVNSCIWKTHLFAYNIQLSYFIYIKVILYTTRINDLVREHMCIKYVLHMFNVFVAFKTNLIGSIKPN